MGSSSGEEYCGDSGRVKQRANLSQRCNLLSQYLKENRASFRHLNLNSIPNGGGGGGVGTTRTMDLFPQESGSLLKNQLPPNSSSSVKAGAAASQMTIFYGGQVIVFNDFPADKAKELMLLASNSTTISNTASTPPQLNEPTNLVQPTNSAAASSNLRNNMIQDSPIGPPTKPITNDLPIMRKASLTRFLEKRKDRITARAPYAKPAETKSWLGLAAQGPAQLEHQL